MAYPFAPLPTVADFVKVVTEEFQGERKKLPVKVTDPDGVCHEFDCLERRAGSKVYVVPIELPDSEVLTPSVLRSLCARLRVPPKRFGLTLG